MMYYYADSNNQPVGPYTLEQLKQLNLSGVVQAETYVVEEGGSQWQPFKNLLITQTPAGSAPLPSTPPPVQENKQATDIGPAILWFLCCFPIGFMQWGQTAKGWIWFLISLCTGGFGSIVVIVDYWMCYSIQQKRKLGEWEFFPSK